MNGPKVNEPKIPLAARSYGLWMAVTEGGNWDLTRMRNAAPGFGYRPKVSILLPIHNPEASWLEQALDSVIAQAYPDWELCVCDDASTDEHVHRILDLYERLDERIKIKRLRENENICAATNHALSLATGEFVGMLDHDDELAPHAIFEVVRLLQEHPEADLVYSDEDKVEDDRRRDPHFKPGWSPDLAMSCNYLCHFSVYRRSMLEELGGWREGFDGAQDLELVQRVGEYTDRVFHIPQMLYHWRMVTGSTASGAAGKPYTHERARRAIQDSLERQGVSGEVRDSGFMPNTFKVEREISGQPRVSIVVPFSGESPDALVEELRAKSSYPSYTVSTLDTRSGVLTSAASGETYQLKGYTNLSGMYNAAVREAGGEYVALLAPDLQSASEGWLEELLQHAQRDEVGAVGGRLDLPDGRVFQSGLVLNDGEGEPEPHLYRHCNHYESSYWLFFELISNRSALSSECMMIRRDAFEEAGGFDESRFRSTFADVDLCLRLGERGYRMVVNPDAHFTCTGTADRSHGLSRAEAAYARQRWGHVLGSDPFYNPHLAWDPERLQPSRAKPWPVKQPETPAPSTESGNAQATTQQAPQDPQPLPSPVELPPPFFIVGHGRSGTTWLELTLNSHPEIVCKGSGMFFGRGLPLYEDQRSLPGALERSEGLRTWHEMRPNYWKQGGFEEELPGLVKAVADSVMASELAASGKRLAGDRTPHHVSYLEELYELYPDAKVIHIIRDGRDVAISNIHAIWQNARDLGGPIDLEPELVQKRDAYLADREAFLARGQSIFTGERIDQLAASWRDAVSKGRADGRRLFEDNYHEVRYESLLEDPHSELSRVLGFLGTETGPETVEAIVERNSFEKITGRKPGQEDPSSFNRRGTAGDWKEVFNEEDRRAFEEQAGPLLAELGYESESEPAQSTESGSAEASPTPEPRPSARVPVARLSKENPPFFVVGHGRSGTTWSERLLNSHPEVLCKGSGMFFGRKMGLFEGRKTLPAALEKSEDLRIWHEMHQNYWSDRPFEEAVPEMVRSITGQILYTQLKQSGMKIVGDRTPHHVSCLDEIYELYPDAKVIHLIRDGRDVAISNVHAFWNSARDRNGPIDLEPEELQLRDAYLADREAFLARGESVFARSRIEHLAKSWRYIVNRGRNQGQKLFGENYHEVRYESLLEEPHSTLGGTFDFLGVSREPSVVEQVVEDNRFEKRSQGRSPGEEDSFSFLRKGIHGDWKNVFNERDKEIFKEQTGDLLVTLGYEKDMNW